jgi:hypothetical protein
MALHALVVYHTLQKDSAKVGSVTTARLAQLIRFSSATVYRQTAATIAVVGAEAHAVVHFYSQLEAIEKYVDVIQPREELVLPRAVEHEGIQGILQGLINAVWAARPAIPHLEPTSPVTERNDRIFIEKVESEFKGRQTL